MMRGQVEGMDPAGSFRVLTVKVPMAEMLSYAPALRSMTQGRSSFTMELSHYDPVPKQVQDKIVAEAEAEKEAKAAS